MGILVSFFLSLFPAQCVSALLSQTCPQGPILRSRLEDEELTNYFVFHTKLFSKLHLISTKSNIWVSICLIPL